VPENSSATDTNDLGLVGVSGYMAALRRQIRLFGPGEFPVLIQGDSGTGKELVAQALHACSRRSANRLVTVNCPAIPRNLEESEFFGHVKGSFTGAERTRDGLVKMADHSTLFLDEVGETSAEVQAKLLRVLDKGELTPVGSTDTVRVDIRVVSATNRDLAGMVKKGAFREDLYYRLKGAVVTTQPLRAHPEDIPSLVRHFLAQGGTAEELRVDQVAMGYLAAHNWPGNVRELCYTVEVLRVMANSSGAVDGESVRGLLSLNASGDTIGDGAAAKYAEAKEHALGDFDRAYFEGLLRVHNGNVSRAAAAAGMHRPNLLRKLRALGLRAEQYRTQA
jgi:DNA-binding NtrC family response regulator